MASACLLVLAQTVDVSTLPKALDYIMNGGIAVVVFIIWYFTFRYMIKQHDKTITDYADLVRETKEDYKELVREIKEGDKKVINDFVTIVKEQMELYTYISGLMQRVELKMDELLRKQ